MSWVTNYQGATGTTFYVTLRKWQATALPTFFWDWTNEIWEAVTPTTDNFLALTQSPAGSSSHHVYSDDTFATYTGWILEEIWNANDNTGCVRQTLTYMRAGVQVLTPAPPSAVLAVDSDYRWTAVPNGTCNQIVLADASYDGYLAFDLSPGLNPHTTLDQSLTPTVTDTGSTLTPTDVAVSQDGLHVHFKIGATPVVAGTDYSMEVQATATDGKTVITTGTLRGT